VDQLTHELGYPAAYPRAGQYLVFGDAAAVVQIAVYACTAQQCLVIRNALAQPDDDLVCRCADVAYERYLRALLLVRTLVDTNGVDPVHRANEPVTEVLHH
jgi:hypothetical protein